MNISVLKNQYPGVLAYVVGSGKSLDYINRQVFNNGIIITVNEVFRIIHGSFALMHHHEHAQEAIDARRTVVTSEYDCGFLTWKRHDFQGSYYTYHHGNNSLTPNIDHLALENPEDDRLVVSANTTSEAMQFATHLGATTIMLVGCDGGSLDGQRNFEGYNGGHQTTIEHLRDTTWILEHTATALRKRGVHVYSLNPFINFRLEGHIYGR